MQNIDNNQPIEKKKVGCGMSLLIVSAVIFIFYLLINSIDSHSNDYGLRKEYNITLSVTGTAPGASITYVNDTGGTEQIGSAKIPWTKTYNCTGSKHFYISAQNEYSEGTIVVTIYKDNVAIKTARSSGSYVIAETSAIIDE